MKKILIVILVFLLTISSTAYAVERYCNTPLNEQEKYRISGTFKWEPISSPILKGEIANYAVNKSTGEIAVCYSFNNNRNAFGVFDKDGNYLYGYSFESSERNEVDWYNDYVCIVCYRSYIAVIVDENAFIKDIYDCDLANYRDESNKKVQYSYIDGLTYEGHYIIDIFPGLGYNKITATDKEGNVKTVIELTENGNALLTTILIIVGFAALVVPVTVWVNKRRKNQPDEENINRMRNYIDGNWRV